MNQLRLFISITFVSILVSGCAATYHAAKKGPSGYRDLQLQENVFYVEYTESVRSDWKQVHHFALKRCAEITKNRGYKFFDVISKDEQSVYLKSSVDKIIVSDVGGPTPGIPVSNTYDVGGKKVEGRRVIYRIKLMNE